MTRKYLQAAMGLLFCSLVSSGCGPQEEPELAMQASALSTAAASHCVVPLVSTRSGESPSATARTAAEPSCFPSLSDALSFATHGELTVSPSDSVPEVLAAVKGYGNNPLTSTYVIGIEFQHANFGGASLTFTAGATCDNYAFVANSMPSGWNDIISSSMAFSGCGHAVHYEHNNQGGAAIDTGAVSSYIGPAMNDRTSSILWYR